MYVHLVLVLDILIFIIILYECHLELCCACSNHTIRITLSSHVICTKERLQLLIFILVLVRTWYVLCSKGFSQRQEYLLLEQKKKRHTYLVHF